MRSITINNQQETVGLCLIQPICARIFHHCQVDGQKYCTKNKTCEFGIIQYFLNQQKPKQCLWPCITSKDQTLMKVKIMIALKGSQHTKTSLK